MRLCVVCVVCMWVVHLRACVCVPVWCVSANLSVPFVLPNCFLVSCNATRNARILFVPPAPPFHHDPCQRNSSHCKTDSQGKGRLKYEVIGQNALLGTYE